MGVRLTPSAMTPALAFLRRLVFDPRVPFARQRSRLETFTRIAGMVPGRTQVDVVQLRGVQVLRVVALGARTDRAVVHLHGGGFCVGSPTLAKPFAAALSGQASCVVYVPDYRLAPEHPFPAGLEDAFAVCDAVAAEHGDLMAVTGDSAGAALAVSSVLRMRREGRRVPHSLGLVCPMLDLSHERPGVAEDRLLSPEWLARCVDAYAGQAVRTDPLVSPLLAEDAELTGLPPTWVVSASHDTLAPDSWAFTERARSAGVTVHHEAEEGLWHDFPLQAGTVSAADHAVRSLATFFLAHR